MSCLNAASNWPSSATGRRCASISASGGYPLLLTPGDFMAEHVEMSPDGRYLTFSSGVNQGSATTHDIWVVDLTTGIAEDSWGDVDKFISVERVIGTNFADWFMGNTAANQLNGMGGNDTLAGGGGNDTFVFWADHGNDQINDFNTGDILDLAAFGFKTVDDVIAHATGHELGVIIQTSATSSIVLVDVNVTSLATLGYIFA